MSIRREMWRVLTKAFLDDEGGILKIARMKNLKMLGALVLLCGTLGSCGVPMAAVRTVMNTPQTAVNALNEVSLNP